MHFIVAMPCECGEGRPDGCERECRGGEGSVGEASCFWAAFVVVGDARSCDEKPVGVDAVWGAGHKGGLIGAGVVFVYPGEIVGGDGADCLHLIGEGFAEGGDGEFVTFSGLVEFGEQSLSARPRCAVMTVWVPAPPIGRMCLPNALRRWRASVRLFRGVG